MGTVLTYRNDSDRPFCEIALDSGDRVQMQFDQNGLPISRVPANAGPSEVLFEGDHDLIGDICAALMGPAVATSKAPLELLASIVVQLRSAVDVREAFRAAERAL